MWETIQPFNVLILYDTARSAACAIAVYERLQQNLEPDYQFQMQSWRFSVLGLPSVALWAKRDAATADMVIVAWAGDSDEMDGIKPLLEDSSGASSENRRAFVSLFTGPEPGFEVPQRLEIAAFLQTLAESADMDLISSFSLSADRLANQPQEEVCGVPTMITEPGSSAVALKSSSAPVLAAGFYHGGINE